MASFTSHVDSVDVSDSLVVVGLSALEGNVWDGGIQLLNVENGEILASKESPSGMAMVRFLGNQGSNSNQIVGTVCDDGYIRLYTTSMDSIETFQEWDGHDDIASAIAFHAEETNIFATSGWEGTIHFWDLNASNITSPIYTLSEAHTGPIHDIAFAKDPSQPWHLASVGQDRLLRLWDKRLSPNHGCIQLFAQDQASIACVEWSSAGSGTDYTIFTGNDFGEISTLDLRKLINPNSSKNCDDIGFGIGIGIHQNRIRRMKSVVSFKTGEEFLFSGGDDGNLILSSIHPSYTRFLVPPPGFSNNSTTTTNNHHNLTHEGIRVEKRVQEHTDYIADLVIFSHSNSEEMIVLTGSTDNTIRLTDFVLPITITQQQQDDNSEEEDEDEGEERKKDEPMIVS